MYWDHRKARIPLLAYLGRNMYITFPSQSSGQRSSLRHDYSETQTVPSLLLSLPFARQHPLYSAIRIAPLFLKLWPITSSPFPLIVKGSYLYAGEAGKCSPGTNLHITKKAKQLFHLKSCCTFSWYMIWWVPQGESCVSCNNESSLSLRVPGTLMFLNWLRNEGNKLVKNHDRPQKQFLGKYWPPFEILIFFCLVSVLLECWVLKGG